MIRRHFARLVSADRAHIEAGARHLAIGLSRIISAALLIEHAAWGLERENNVLPVISAKHAFLVRRRGDFQCESQAT